MSKQDITNKIREKLAFYLNRYQRGQVIDLEVLTEQIEAMDKRFDLTHTRKKGKGYHRISRLLREFQDDLVIYENRRWIRA